MWIIAVVGLGCAPGYGYSQLTHEELIDILWTSSIRPLLVSRYPQATASDLTRAHGFAYGGCLIQDIGYYPFGQILFSEMAHYVRTGEFVDAMLRNARDVDELAFAVGALSHYIGDSVGHAEATNPATALSFPNLKAKFGPIISYEQAPIAHGRTEFGFDVAQTVRQRYAPRSYRNHIGFHVARRLLYRTFQEVYGVRTRGILGPARTTLPSYRWAVTTLLPAFLRAQIVLLSKRLPVERQDAARAQFLVNVAGAEYAQAWGIGDSKPGVRSHLLAFVIIMIPKTGKLKILRTQSPRADTERLVVESVNESVDRFRQLLTALTVHPEVDLQLDDLDLDTGKKPTLGDSSLVDEAHTKLALKLARSNGPVRSGLRDYLVSYFSDPGHQPQIKAEELPRLQQAIVTLRQAPK
jgi:hypothetical protein